MTFDGAHQFHPSGLAVVDGVKRGRGARGDQVDHPRAGGSADPRHPTRLVLCLDDQPVLSSEIGCRTDDGLVTAAIEHLVNPQLQVKPTEPEHLNTPWIQDPPGEDSPDRSNVSIISRRNQLCDGTFPSKCPTLGRRLCIVTNLSTRIG